MDKRSKRRLTLSPMFCLFIVFLILRLTEVIEWSWWWVTAPLWGPIAFIAVIMILFIPVYVTFAFIVELLDEIL